MHATAENFDDTHGLLLKKISARFGANNSFKDITISQFREVVSQKGRVGLSIGEFQCLWLLVRAQGNIITSDELSYFLYEDSDGDLPLTNVSQVFIGRVRKKLEKIGSTISIETIHGFGYRLN